MECNGDESRKLGVVRNDRQAHGKRHSRMEVHAAGMEGSTDPELRGPWNRGQPNCVILTRTSQGEERARNPRSSGISVAA
jgi:hypothetical protein